MAKGSPIVSLRVPAALLAEIDARCERSVQFGKLPLDRTALILSAVREKLDHYRRSNRKGGAK